MKRKLQTVLLILLIGSLSICKAQNKISKKIHESYKLAIVQYSALDDKLADSLFPRNIDKEGNLVTNRSTWWTSGFFPASLWYLFAYSKDICVKEKALKKLKAVEKEKLNISDHDIGFKIYCPFGNAMKFTGDSSYTPIIITAANSLTKRFNPRVGLIRSWGDINNTKEYTVIIDNMMNLELLFAATRLTGDSSYYKIATAQADNTILHHFRDDGSSYHVVDYNPQTGEVMKKRTAQGFADGSAWARGQSWGLYGYTVCYRETKDKRYLHQAEKIADFILNHSNLPADKIPYWDFNAPNIPTALRDASAAAIMSSALFELKNYVSKNKSNQYEAAAIKVLETLGSPEYRTVLNEKT